MLDTQPVVSFENLRVEFDTNSGLVVGVEDVSFHINPGETVCVVIRIQPIATCVQTES